VAEKQGTVARKRTVSPEDITRFETIRNVGYAIIMIVFGVSISQNDFGRVWSPPASPVDTPLYIARIILFVLLAVLMVRWILATHHEYDIWMRWLNNPLEPQQVYGAMIALAVVLGLLLAFPHHILFVTIIVSCSALFTYWTQWLCNDHFERALRETRRGAADALAAQVLDAMEIYWLKRPQLGRMAVIIFTSCIAFAFAFGGSLVQGSTARTLNLVAYAIVATNILVGEIVIGYWRHVRDKSIYRALRAADGEAGS